MAVKLDHTLQQRWRLTAPVVSAPFTISTWVYWPLAPQPDEGIWSISATGSLRLLLYMVVGSVFLFTPAGSNLAGPSLATGTWHHVVVIERGSTRTMIVNGTSYTQTATYSATGNTLTWGSWFSTNHSSAALAETAVWNVELTSGEAAALRRGASPSLVRPQGLVYLAQLERQIADRRANATLTFNGGTIAAFPHPRTYR